MRTDRHVLPLPQFLPRFDPSTAFDSKRAGSIRVHKISVNELAALHWMRQQLFRGVWWISETIRQSRSHSELGLRWSSIQPSLQKANSSSTSFPLSNSLSFSSAAPPQASVRREAQKPQVFMASDTVASVTELSIHSTTTEHSRFPNCYPSVNPVDSYRGHIAELIGDAVGIDPLTIFTRLQWTNTLDKGDLVLPVRFNYPFSISLVNAPSCSRFPLCR